MKVIIIGGVATGASCAARLRRLDENAEITIYEKSGYISYANCGLPYYIGNIIKDRDELTLQSPESFKSRFNIDVFVKHEVISINPENNTIKVLDLSTNTEFSDTYDKLVLSPGAKALSPFVFNSEFNNIFTLRNVEDTYKIDDFINFNKPKTALVIGGGFIGIEMVENLSHLGLEVTLVEAAPQVLSILDCDMASIAHNTLRDNGINLILNGKISSFEKKDNKTISTLENGKSIESDIVILALGVTPDTTLAENAGLKLGIKKSIIVNERLQTSDPNIYAGGDAVEVDNFITGDKALISLAGPANKMGRIIADNIAGFNSTYKGSLGSSVLKLFNQTIAVTGINERIAKTSKIDYDKVLLSPFSNATYYPGGKQMTMKILFEKESEKILGGQIIGDAGVDKRIDVLATAIRSGLKARELAGLELAYAPPYSSAKDPINMAGFIIDDLLSGLVKQFHYEDIDNLRNDENAYLIDARTEGEYKRGFIEGFINIPLDSLRERLNEIPKGKRIYVMCLSAQRSYVASRILKQNGFDTYNFSGGYRFYSFIKKDLKEINKG